MPKPQPGHSPLYAGTFDCAAKTVRHEVILFEEILMIKYYVMIIYNQGLSWFIQRNGCSVNWCNSNVRCLFLGFRNRKIFTKTIFTRWSL
jgi:hypothetical protein